MKNRQKLKLEIIKGSKYALFVINKVQAKMKSFAAALLVVSAQADEHYDDGHGHYHNDYNTGYASSAPLLTPNFSEQIEGFKYRDTLFGTENYQLQVAKTANMLIATEALRLSTANLQNRVEYA